MFEVTDTETNFNLKLLQQRITSVLGFLIQFTTPSNPADEIELEHKLGRIPTEVITTDPTEGCIAFRGNTSWTDSKVYLKGTIGNKTIKVRVR